MNLSRCTVALGGAIAVSLAGCGSSPTTTPAPAPAPAPAPTPTPPPTPTPAPGPGPGPAPAPGPTPLELACDAEWKANLFAGTPPTDEATAPTPEDYAAALLTLNDAALQNDLAQLFTTSHPCWPADFGNYGPMFVRLAWHCSGSWRENDGKGGCGGGRHRFDPERSWDDNTNLDKARALLHPIKQKYGDALSWGDLFIAAGTTALQSMGAPLTRKCYGRTDDTDGAKSDLLGPSVAQEETAPCPGNYNCQAPLGAITIGLIYLNPEGVVTEENGVPNPDPALLVDDVIDTFARMGHTDEHTVALIGGGHAIGKCHGACPSGAGMSPRDTYATDTTAMPWMGACDNGQDLRGKGSNAFTAGFEGPWTKTPTTWSNDFFKDNRDLDWEVFTGPGGKSQWKVVNPQPDETHLMRLTSDMTLKTHPAYKTIADEFASDMDKFNNAFNIAWDLLTVVNGAGVWSSNAWCDDGSDPRVSLDPDASHKVNMLDTDIVV